MPLLLSKILLSICPLSSAGERSKKSDITEGNKGSTVTWPEVVPPHTKMIDQILFLKILKEQTLIEQ